MAILRSIKEAHWHPASFQHHALKHNYKSWLLDPGSLTQKLIAHSQGQFRVEVLQQRTQRAQLSEYRALKLNRQRWAVVREVILYGQNTPWVFARTIIPLSTLKGPLKRLHHLGNRPLGEALFAEPSMRRKGVEVARVKARHLPKVAQQLKPRWGRRSVFTLKNKPLLVSEIFLADLLD